LTLKALFRQWHRMADSEEEIDYYEVLGLQRTATAEEVRKAYRKLAIRWHPDKNPDDEEGAAEAFKLVAEAYTVLCDADKRAAYDRFGAAGVRFEESAGPGSASRQPRQPSPAPGEHSHYHSHPGAAFGGHHFHPHVSFGFADNLFRAFFGGGGGGAFPGMFPQERPGGGMPMPSPFGFDPFAGFPGMAAPGMGGLFGAPLMGGGLFGAMASAGPGTSISMGYGGGGGMLSSSSSSFFSSSSSSFGGSGGGASTMTRSVTTVEGGRRVTRTTRTVRYGDGREESTTEEQVEGLPPTITGSSRAPAALGAAPAHVGSAYGGSGPMGVRVAGSSTSGGGGGYGASPYTGVAATEEEAGGADGGGASGYGGGYYSDSDDNTPSATYSPSGTAPGYVSASASGYVSGSSSAGYGAGISREVGAPLPAASAATRGGAAPGVACSGAPSAHSSGRQTAAGESAHSTSSAHRRSGGGPRPEAHTHGGGGGRGATAAAGSLPHDHYTRAASAAAAAPASMASPPPAAAPQGGSSAQYSRSGRVPSAAAFSGDGYYDGLQQQHSSRATVSRR